MKKMTKIFLIVSIVCSLVAGLVCTFAYFYRYVMFRDTFEMCSYELSCVLENSNWDPNLWMIIPIGFVVGFIIPAIAWVIGEISSRLP